MYFAQIIVVDFEYEVAPGGLPVPLCMVAYVLDSRLRHVKTVRLWRGQFGHEPPFDIGPNTLFVAYSAWAEMTCFMQLGWKFPAHIYDLHTAYLAASNFLYPKIYGEPKAKREPKKLSNACAAYGIAGWENIDKPHMAKDIGEGRWQIYGQAAVFNYCEEDVRNSVELLRRQLRGTIGFDPTSVELVLNWSEYSAKVIAQVQARGMPIDMRMWNLVQENKQAVIAALVRRFDPSQGSNDPIYTLNGEWETVRFARWLIEHGYPWPRLASGALDLSEDAFGMMMYIPGIEGLYALRQSLRVISTANLPIGPDGINRPSLFPFGTLTGRNAHGKSLFNCHAGMRSFIRFPPDKIGLYLDWRTQEIGIAATRSADELMMADYRSGDFYHRFAYAAGLTSERNHKVWKDQDPATRQRMKSLVLGVNYGMTVPSIARRLDRHTYIASCLLELFARRYKKFWQWREDRMWEAKLTRRMFASDGWPLIITESPPRRSLYNYPMQADGSVMMRRAAVGLCKAELVPSMLVHDGILFQLDHRDQIEQARTIMRDAGAEVCGGFVVDVDIDKILEHGESYRDKRPMAVAMWTAILDVLREVGVEVAA